MVNKKEQTSETTNLSSILRWAGSKRKIASEVKSMVEKRSGNDYTYYEPFAGGASVLLKLRPKKAIINDINKEIINVYRVVKRKPDKLILILKEMEEKHNADPKLHYYEVRALDRKSDFSATDQVMRAARTIYLNRTCFNGIYRVNNEGEFNVPFGKKEKYQIDSEAIINLSKYLNGCEIKLSTKNILKSYQLFFNQLKKGDFVYLDPPYFRYQKKLYHKDYFGVREHFELKKIVDWLIKKRR